MGGSRYHRTPYHRCIPHGDFHSLAILPRIPHPPHPLLTPLRLPFTHPSKKMDTPTPPHASLNLVPRPIPLLHSPHHRLPLLERLPLLVLLGPAVLSGLRRVKPDFDRG